MSSNFHLYHATLSVLAQTKLVVQVFMWFWGAVHNLGSKGIRGAKNEGFYVQKLGIYLLCNIGFSTSEHSAIVFCNCHWENFPEKCRIHPSRLKSPHLMVLTNKTVREHKRTKYNPKIKHHKIQQNKTTLSPLITLGQEMRWAYSTMLERPHGATNAEHWLHILTCS